MSTIRLDKYLADAGIGTRSQVKKYIKQGLIVVNGETANEPEQKITNGIDKVLFRGLEITVDDFEYYILNKPAGYVSATKDDISPTVMSLLDSSRRDLFPVGRLDKDTEGLLLITNDGALAHKLLSPKHHVDKTYYAVIDRIINETEIDLFAKGLEIGDEDLNIAMPAKLDSLNKPLEFVSSYYNEFLNSTDHKNELGFVLITINEGKYHQIKRMFQKVCRNVLYLKRLSMGNITLPENLEPGQYQKLSQEDILSL